MKLTFRIEYRTAWGEELGVILDGNNSEPIILRTPNGEHWEGEAEMPDLPACVPVSYRYGVYRDGQCIRREKSQQAPMEALLSGPYALVCIISVKCWLSAEIARL